MSNTESGKKGVGESAKPYIIGDADSAGGESVSIVDPAFVERMQKCAERVGSVNALARKANLSQSGIRRYFSGGEPTRKVLIAIANAAEVDFLWLATGAGFMAADAGRGRAVLPKLNAEALLLAVETVEEALSDSGRHLASERKAEMVAAAYELFMGGEGKIDKSVVLRLVKSAT